MEKKNPKKIEDLCPICDKNLYHNESHTKRVGLLEKGSVSGWMCPFCDSQFDLDDNILYIYGEENIKGKA
tara:strand:+ start:330 stop:539 length:210 start_codon:yes stop_codon:yes gene_type:complete